MFVRPHLFLVCWVRAFFKIYKNHTNFMTQANDPINAIVEPSTECSVSIGLTKREYFAAMAMQGVLSTLTNKEALKILAIGMKATKEELQHAEVIVAKASLQHADALIAELNKIS